MAKYDTHIERDEPSWPLRINVQRDYDEDEGTLILSVSEARDIIEALQSLIDTYENGEFVRVVLDSDFNRTNSTSRQYTYRDPSNALAEGDRIIVPVGPLNSEKAAHVVGLGRGTYDGPVKDVLAKLERREL